MNNFKNLIEGALQFVEQGQTIDTQFLLAAALDALDAKPVVIAEPQVVLACNHCHDTAAPEYRLRRNMGQYILLCFKSGDGCWERAPHPVCDFKDHEGVQCDLLAEALVKFGSGDLTRRCAVHIGAAMTPSFGKIEVFPLDVIR